MSKHEKTIEYQYDKVPNKEIIADEKCDIPTHYGYGVRHMQLVILFLCISVVFMARGHLGVTVVAMTSEPTLRNNTLLGPGHRKNYTDIEKNISIGNGSEAFHFNDTQKTVLTEDDADTKSFMIYDWPKSTQEMVLGSFFTGYCIMTFPMGLLAQRWGGKRPIQIALFVNGLISIVTPWLTQWANWKAVCFCRIVQGCSQAGVFPGLQLYLAEWVPAYERATLSSYVYTGTTTGTVIAFQMSGFLGDSRWGWPSTFWAVGALCLIAFAVMTIFGSASPSKCKSITEEEKQYIMGRADNDVIPRRRQVPWKAILTCKHMWGTLATHVGSGVAFVFYFTQVPSYIHYILNINVKSSGILSSLPYVASFFTSIMFGVISDYLTNNNIITLRNARRLFNSISQVGIAVSLVCASFTKSTVVAVFCLVLAMGCHQGIHTGWMVNHIDLAPNFSGTLMAIGNSVMNIINMLMPILVSHVVTDVRNIMQWRIMFFGIAGFAVITNSIFVVLMSSDTQLWNDVIENESTIKDTKFEDLKENKEQE